MKSEGTTQQNSNHDINAEQQVFHGVVQGDAERREHKNIQKGKGEPKPDVHEKDSENDFTDGFPMCHMSGECIGCLWCGNEVRMEVSSGFHEQ